MESKTYDNTPNDIIRAVPPERADTTIFTKTLADCVVLTHDNKILLQQRTPAWSSAGCLNLFGGHVESGETPLQGMMRELHEELGAQIIVNDVVTLGAITEAETDHSEIVHGYFWHDKHATITGCYECEAAYYDRIAAACAHPKIMDYTVWFLRLCQQRGLVP